MSGSASILVVAGSDGVNRLYGKKLRFLPHEGVIADLVETESYIAKALEGHRLIHSIFSQRSVIVYRINPRHVAIA